MVFVFNLKNKSILSSLVLAASLYGTPTLGMDGPHLNAQGSSASPSKFAVFQQDGYVCHLTSWLNLKKVRSMRDLGGNIQMKHEDYHTKFYDYASCLPRYRAYYQDHQDLRNMGGAYATYEADLRQNGIRSNSIFNADGKNIKEMDWNPLTTERRVSYTPFNIQVIDLDEDLLTPILEKNGKKYLYDYEKKAAYPLSLYSEAQCIERGFNFSVFDEPDTNNTRFGSEVSYYVKTDFEYPRERFYHMGLYQHMLFACGLGKDNLPMTEKSPHFSAYKEFQEKVSSNPLNPWNAINKDDLFEYHLAEIFKNNNVLKQKAMKSVNYYNDCWKYYKESFGFWDGPNPVTLEHLPLAPSMPIAMKQTYMPGEDQALGLSFSEQLRFLWAGSISDEAVFAISELEEEMESFVPVIKTFSFIPGMPSAASICKSARDKKYTLKESENFWDNLFNTDTKNTFSFLDVWKEIQPILAQRLNGKKDLATFYGHGSVISFDRELIKLQQHQDREMADDLGFEHWESLYDKEIKPFYKCPGTAADRIQFMDE